MIVFLTLIFAALLFVLMRIKVLPNKGSTWLLMVPYELVLIIGFFIPMQWGAPQGDVRTLTYAVSIVPNVPGEVAEIVAEPNAPLREGDVIFTLDPTPYQAAVDGLNAQLQLARTRLRQAEQLAAQQAGSVFEVEAYQAQVNGLEAQLTNAQWNLDSTVIRAPADGYVTNLALRPGARVTNLPLAAAGVFIDTSETVLGAQVHQIYARHVEPGQTAEISFKFLPGRVYPATVESVLQVTAQGQLFTSGAAPQPVSSAPGPFFVRLRLDDPELAEAIPAGAVGQVAIYTEEVQMAHVIRKVMIRMNAIMNYVVPA